jgi:hypothetical protein
MKAHSQQGQSLIEFLIAMFGFGFLLLAMLQAILFYRAKATVDYAAMEAARAGAVHGVDMGEMRKGLARGMLPLLATASGDPSKVGLLARFEEARLVDIPLHATIEVINPTKAAWNDFKEPQWDGTNALPNDSLNYRPTSLGSSSGMSVQDANILKIKVTYRYPIIVPIVDRVMNGFFSQVHMDPAYSVAGGHEVYSVPIVASAEVRMQSPITNQANLK